MRYFPFFKKKDEIYSIVAHVKMKSENSSNEKKTLQSKELTEKKQKGNKKNFIILLFRKLSFL